MIKKIGLSAVAALALMVCAAPTPAKAGVHFGVAIGGGYGYRGYPAYRAYPAYPAYGYAAPAYYGAPAYPAYGYVAPAYGYPVVGGFYGGYYGGRREIYRGRAYGYRGYGYRR